MASVLGLAALAFVCDRVFLQGGAAAGPAAPAALAKAGPEESKAPAAAEPSVDASAPTLAERLKKATEGQSTASNPFNPKWRGVVASGPKQDAKPGSEVKIEVTAEAFAKTHPLTSVSKGVAMIARKPYRVGKPVDGWVLREVDVTGLKARLERGSVSVELHIKAMDPGAITQSGLKGDPEDGDR